MFTWDWSHPWIRSKDWTGPNLFTQSGTCSTTGSMSANQLFLPVTDVSILHKADFGPDPCGSIAM